MSSGRESSCTRIPEHASSTRSMALSGRNRSVMYRSLSSAAMTSALQQDQMTGYGNALVVQLGHNFESL